MHAIRTSWRTLLAFAVILAAPAMSVRTAAAQTRPQDDPAHATKGTRSRANGPITREEIEASTMSDTYRLIYKARPNWLRTRAAGNELVAPVHVYVDGMPMGTVEYLSRVPLVEVKTITHLSGIEATGRYGTDHGSGAILIVTQH
jgi:hypothetical protein